MHSGSNIEKPSQDLKKCEQQLRFLDYLRKSRCTAVSAFSFAGTPPLTTNPLLCRQTLEDMEKLAKNCLDKSGYNPPKQKK